MNFQSSVIDLSKKESQSSYVIESARAIPSLKKTNHKQVKSIVESGKQKR